MICYIFLINNFHIIMNKMFGRSVAIFGSYFSNHLPYFFWFCTIIYLGNVIFPYTPFEVFDNFSGFGSALFIVD